MTTKEIKRAIKSGQRVVLRDDHQCHICQDRFGGLPWAEWPDEGLRLHRADADKTIQGYEDGVFWERNTRSVLK